VSPAARRSQSRLATGAGACGLLCGGLHREVVYAFQPSGLIRYVVRKAIVDSAVCVLMDPKLTTASYWSKLVRCPLLSGRQAPDGCLWVRALGVLLLHATSFYGLTLRS
jgi:hypothetical protein